MGKRIKAGIKAALKGELDPENLLLNGLTKFVIGFNIFLSLKRKKEKEIFDESGIPFVRRWIDFLFGASGTISYTCRDSTVPDRARFGGGASLSGRTWNRVSGIGGKIKYGSVILREL